MQLPYLEFIGAHTTHTECVMQVKELRTLRIINT